MRLRNLNLTVCALVIQNAVAHAVGSSKFLPKRDPCVPLAQGYEALDDSPIINDALKACGNGGTIVLPADQIYSIRSPIDFSPCKNCDFQIEGTLYVIRGQWDYWRNIGATFKISNVAGARIRSVTGKGLVDGNAVEYYSYRTDNGLTVAPAFVHINRSSSDITFENLSMKNVMHKFFRIEGNSNRVTLSHLNLTMTDQAGYYPRNEFDAVGIEIGKSTNTKVTNINIDFRARGGQVVGYCAAIDIGAHDVKIRDINCINNYAGVMVSPGTIGSFNIAEEDRPNAISNIYISNLSFSGRWATGILSQLNLFAMRNITWNGVTVLSGTPVVNNLCYQKIRGMTSHWANCSPWVQVNVTDVWFKSYRGNLPPEEDWRKDLYGFSNSTLDLHLEDWMSTDVTEV